MSLAGIFGRVALLIVALGAFGTAAAQAPAAAPVGRRVAYRYDPLTDLSLTVALGALGAGSIVVDHELPAPLAGNPADVFVLDRGVARRAVPRAAARTSSDVLLFAGVGFGALASAFSVENGRLLSAPSRRRERFRRFGLFVESLAATNAVTTVVKLAVRRPRPYTYAAGYDSTTARFDDGLSFFSGHTSTLAAVSATASYFAFAEAPGSARAYATLGTGVAATSVVAALRIRAGKHFPTDVVTGALVGTSVGLLVPHMHRRTGLSLSADVGTHAAVVLVGGRL